MISPIFYLLIGLFLFSFFGSFLNYAFYYSAGSIKFMFNGIYTVLSYFGLSLWATAILSIMYYLLMFFILYNIFRFFVPLPISTKD